MVILNRKTGNVINFDNVNNIYPKAEKLSAAYSNGTGSQIAEYETPEQALTAAEMIAKQLSLGNLCTVPTLEEVKSKIFENQDKTSIHHADNGKKTVRRGGS